MRVAPDIEEIELKSQALDYLIAQEDTSEDALKALGLAMYQKVSTLSA